MTTLVETLTPRTVMRGVWRIADPKITLASVASMLLGAAAAARDGDIAWGWLALTVLGIFCIEAAKNASGEIFDWQSGTDQAVTEAERTPFSGGKRVLVDKLMSSRQLAITAFVFYLLGGAAGVAIAVWREPAVLWLGLAGASLAYFYHAPPLKLAYRGLGELAVGIAYGPLIACGTYLVQRGTLTESIVFVSWPLGVAIAGFLWINEFPDYRADRLAGKRTLVVRLGRDAAARAFVGLMCAAYALLLLAPLFGAPLAVWWGLIGLPHGVAAALRLLRHASTPRELIAAQGWTLLSFVLMSVGASVGWVLSP